MSVHYRKDIDGLRAIAVLSVLIYHLLPHWMPGGFIGVDVFFVISGFLITLNIHDEIEQRRFSYARFYQKRIRRILPAFYVVCLVSILIATLLFLPADLLEMQKSWKSALLFISNFFFASRYDYFSNNVWEMPLLHTWSLSVEEQFYFIWPSFVLFFYRFGLKKDLLLKWIIGLSLASVMLGQYLLSTPQWVKVAYYSFFTRFGELLIGAVLAEIRGRVAQLPENRAAVIRDLGLFLIFLSCFGVKHTTPFPGVVVLVPTLGAMMVLIGGQSSKGWMAKALSSRVLVGVGLISYSLYLWHWPIFAFFRYFLARVDLTSVEASLATVLTFILSYFSWKWIEQPFRSKPWGFLRTLTLLFALPVSISLLLCVWIEKTNGWPDRFANHDQLTRETQFLSGKFCFGKLEGDCRYGDLNSTTKAFLFGDSNAGHYMPFWDELGKANGFSLAGLAVDRCYPLLDVDGHFPSRNPSLIDSKCQRLIAEALHRVADTKIVILAGAWSGYLLDPKKSNFLSDLDATISFLVKNQKTVLVMEQTPVFSEAAFQRFLRNRYALLPQSWLGKAREDFLRSRMSISDEANAKIKQVVGRFPNAFFIHTTTLIKDPGFPAIGNDLYFMNATHLSEFGSRWLAREIGDQSLTEVREVFRKER